MRWSIPILALLLAAGAAAAQPEKSPESVTVTGTRDRQTLEKLVQGFATPSRITGKIARWDDGVCPLTLGLAPRFAAFVSQRVRDVATEAGAPVSKDKGCKPNIEIAFTTTPQGLIDNIKKKQPEFLGYFDNQTQRDALATIRRPIQAWYLTQTRDVRGKAEVDSPKPGGITIDLPLPGGPPGAGSGNANPAGGQMYTMVLPYARAREGSGSRLGDGLTSGFHHVIIVAEPAKLMDQEIGTLADTIAFLALTQLSSPGTCQPLASIANLLAKDCAPVKALTDNDRAYLKGLYRMRADRIEGVQRAQIAYDMQQSLEGK